MPKHKELKPLEIVEKEKCLNCRFVGDDVVGGYAALVCRKYAPRSPRTKEQNSIFPVTWNDNWCGEWEYDKEQRYKEA